MRLPYVCASVLILSSAAGCHSPAADCQPLDGWKQGGSGIAALPGCVNTSYREAHELGRSLNELRTERHSLDAKIAEDPAEAPVLRRRQRQLDIDIEAIEGLAVIEGWSSITP
ncbi:MAG: hypothetical protein ACT4NL_01705 [Pseudomarimonas sp.]